MSTGIIKEYSETLDAYIYVFETPADFLDFVLSQKEEYDNITWNFRLHGYNIPEGESPIKHLIFPFGCIIKFPKDGNVITVIAVDKNIHNESD